MNEQLFQIICALCANPNIEMHDATDYARRICAIAEAVFKHAIETDRRMYEEAKNHFGVAVINSAGNVRVIRNHDTNN